MASRPASGSRPGGGGGGGEGAAGDARGAAANEEPSALSQVISMAPKMILIYMATQWVLGANGPIAHFFPSIKPPTAPVPSPNSSPLSSSDTTSPHFPLSDPSSSSSNNNVGGKSAYGGYGGPEELIPLWPLGTDMSMSVVLNSDLEPEWKNTGGLSSDFSGIDMKEVGESGELSPSSEEEEGVVKRARKDFEPFKFGDWDWNGKWNGLIKLPESVQRNSTPLFADIFLHPASTSLDPKEERFDKNQVVIIRKVITRLMPLKKERKQKNLLSSGSELTNETTSEEEEKDLGPPPLVPYYHPNLTINIVSDANPLKYAQLPPVLQAHITPAPHFGIDLLTSKGYHYPIIFPNDFWLLREHMNPINETVDEVKFSLTVYPISYFKYQVYATFDEAFNRQSQQASSGSTPSAGGEIDEIKRMLIETNPILLGTTFVVSLLHSLFEFLAFKSDVSHWRNKKELIGVSVRTILTNVFVQLIILLYLVDNNENTSWMILLGQGVGLLIEAWKITKAVNIGIRPNTGPSRYTLFPLTLLPYRVDIQDKHVLTEEEKKTQEYDKLAFKYVATVAIPLLAAYTVYSLIYDEHRGWYSFIISTLTSYVYMFGFVQLIPQLIINYKLKSVAHLPWKAMIYKTLSTIVDDFFAFCIKMPWLHRLACFRDDVVFVVLLYQYYIYRVDPTRANEYGQVAVDVDADADTKAIEEEKTTSTKGSKGKKGGKGESKKDR